MARYPFLPQTKEYIGKLGIDLTDLGSLEAVVDRAKERIAATFEFKSYFFQKPRRHLEVEIASFPTAVLLVKGVSDNLLTDRYAESEAKKMYEYLVDERDDLILNIAKSLNWNLILSKKETLPYKLHFVKYIQNATRGRLVHNPKWKLVNRSVQNGQVSLTKREVCRLLQEEIREHIIDRTKERLVKIPSNVQESIEEIKAEFLKRKPHLTEFDRIIEHAEESEYPPCVQNLLDRATKGQRLSHAERFTLVTYLLQQGVSVDGVINLFSNVTDFREDKTRYQVQHLAGQRGSQTAYKPYNCSTLQTHGICVNLNDPICRTIRNPVSYHIRKKAAGKKTA